MLGRKCGVSTHPTKWHHWLLTVTVIAIYVCTEMACALFLLDLHCNSDVAYNVSAYWSFWTLLNHGFQMNVSYIHGITTITHTT